MRVTKRAHTILNVSGISAFQVKISTIIIAITYLIMNSAFATYIVNQPV
jgi:hypothetical protein